ncbi:MAG: glucuronate isomerase, partial [Phycisphaerae bacterium]
PCDRFWAMTKREQADCIWKHLFLDRSPVSEACRGVLTVLHALGLDVGRRDLAAVRSHFASISAEEYTNTVFRLANVRAVIMTNDPFDDAERPVWLAGGETDARFLAALRIDVLLNQWDRAIPRLREWGYEVRGDLDDADARAVRRFLADWIGRISPRYMAVSLPPDFAFPGEGPRGRLIERCILPAAREAGIPLAMMIGVRRQVNPALRLAGDGMGRASMEPIERLCTSFPENRFLVTMLSRENQHELCVTARKLPNLLVFGCWWFLNNPGFIEEMTRARLEMLGLSFVPQHSDARVMDQLIYKWAHSRAVIGEVLADKYVDLLRAGWAPAEAEIRRDVADLFGGLFERFCGKRQTGVEA